eukprot:TRINITY_DN105347_c0_g1_i1.p1 TRINITY_DN105347_c0_g1~~TRINITY_DN105347_c0_g1_i1.p1  ORF type:complete len:723 (+),score=126.76 TRINITY_DN105347_c0_g1_i1:34-2169(+)
MEPLAMLVLPSGPSARAVLQASDQTVLTSHRRAPGARVASAFCAAALASLVRSRRAIILPLQRCLRSRRVDCQGKPFVARATANQEATVQSFIDGVNEEYERLHFAFESEYWSTRMAIDRTDIASDALNASKTELEAFLADSKLLKQTQQYLTSGGTDDVQKQTLQMFERTFQCYCMSPEACSLRQEAVSLESTLVSARARVRVQVKKNGRDMKFSTEQCHKQMSVDESEGTRKMCYRGLQSIGSYVCNNGFIDLVQKRNQMARLCGHSDFFDYKISRVERFSKQQLFEVLDSLELQSRYLLEETNKRLEKEFGKNALEPWNTTYLLASDLTKKLDPYFPCENVVDMWMQTYAGMGIKYRGATLVMDLLERNGKYPNAFCHWPQPAWLRSQGTWTPSEANFTANANPINLGSGYDLLGSIMHEAGHAAHYANIVHPSPLFAQERAPFSTSYSESQSMFLEGLVDDVAWRARYARDREGHLVPWELLEEELRSSHQLAVLSLRRRLELPYFEKAVYELPDEELTPERVQQLAADVEMKMGGSPSPWPVLSVSHLLEDATSCYYHSYVLAEMAVHQIRQHLLEEHGSIIDNPKVGPILTENFWRPGGSAAFFDIIEELTKAPLSCQALVQKLTQPLDELLESERCAYEQAIQARVRQPRSDLEMHIRFVHGEDEIANSVEEGSCEAAASKFSDYVSMRRRMLMAMQTGDLSCM